MLLQNALADSAVTYGATPAAPHLQHQSLPKLMTVVQVIMTPHRLGYTQASVGIVPERVMQKATRACLLACADLHSAEPQATCHCDVRFANVLCTWDLEPFLADLEFTHFSPWQVINNTHGMLMQAVEELTVFNNTLGVVQVKQDFYLKDWHEGTLDDCYTPQSETYQIGVMLLKSRHLSAYGLTFAHELKSKTINAGDADKDPYLQKPIPMCGGGAHLHRCKFDPT